MRKSLCLTVCCPATLLLLFTVGLPSTSPAQDRPLIQVQSERVLLDIIVVDSEGNFVRNLSASDFLVRENGKERPVTNLILVDKARPASSRSPAGPSEATVPYEDLFQEDRFVIVIDRVSMEHNDFRRALEALPDLMRRLPRGTQVSLLLFDGTLDLVHPFSADSESLTQTLSEISRHQARLTDSSESEAFEEIASLFTERLAFGFRVSDTTSVQDVLRRTVSGAVNIANRHLRLKEQVVLSFLRGMRSLVRTLGNIPGEKTLLLLSGGYSLFEGDDLREAIRDNLQGRLGGGQGVQLMPKWLHLFPSFGPAVRAK